MMMGNWRFEDIKREEYSELDTTYIAWLSSVVYRRSLVTSVECRRRRMCKKSKEKQVRWAENHREQWKMNRTAPALSNDAAWSRPAVSKNRTTCEKWISMWVQRLLRQKLTIPPLSASRIIATMLERLFVSLSIDVIFYRQVL